MTGMATAHIERSLECPERYRKIEANRCAHRSCHQNPEKKPTNSMIHIIPSIATPAEKPTAVSKKALDLLMDPSWTHHGITWDHHPFGIPIIRVQFSDFTEKFCQPWNPWNTKKHHFQICPKSLKLKPLMTFWSVHSVSRFCQRFLMPTSASRISQPHFCENDQRKTTHLVISPSQSP